MIPDSTRRWPDRFPHLQVQKSHLGRRLIPINSALWMIQWRTHQNRSALALHEQSTALGGRSAEAYQGDQWLHSIYTSGCLA